MPVTASMPLVAATAGALVAAASATSLTPVGAERRRSERVQSITAGWLSGESNDRRAQGRHVAVNDISTHGIGFHDPRQPYRIGACHWLVISGGPTRVSNRVRIVSCRKNDDGGYDVGAMFY